jgi:hypothetical protein
MKVAVMQPYFAPYLGYFQLINAVDQFILLDDVNYISGGWVNRNRILIQGAPAYITLPIEKASPFKRICDLSLVDDQYWRRKLLKTVQHNYKKAPYFEATFELLNQMMAFDNNGLCDFLHRTLFSICQHLNIATPFSLSSQITPGNISKGEARILELCHTLEADQYINLIGGQTLYSKSNFCEEQIDLYFLEKNPLKYEQFSADFVDNLSIIDVMMFNSHDTVRTSLLGEYRLV